MASGAVGAAVVTDRPCRTERLGVDYGAEPSTDDVNDDADQWFVDPWFPYWTLMNYSSPGSSMGRTLVAY